MMIFDNFQWLRWTIYSNNRIKQIILSGIRVFLLFSGRLRDSLSLTSENLLLSLLPLHFFLSFFLPFLNGVVTACMCVVLSSVSANVWFLSRSARGEFSIRSSQISGPTRPTKFSRFQPRPPLAPLVLPLCLDHGPSSFNPGLWFWLLCVFSLQAFRLSAIFYCSMSVRLLNSLWQELWGMFSFLCGRLK